MVTLTMSVFPMKPSLVVLTLLGLLWPHILPAQTKEQPPLNYSYCGYALSEQPLPVVPIRAVVSCESGNQRDRIQAAIDYVSSLTPDAQGFRGTVLLEAGRYELDGSLCIAASGVVLRGSGTSEQGTELYAVGKETTFSVICLQGNNDLCYGAEHRVLQHSLPVGTQQLSVPNHRFRVGDRIVVCKRGPQVSLRREGLPHSVVEGERESIGERGIVSIDGDLLTLDAPITYDFSGELLVQSLSWKGRVERSGVENLRITAACEPSESKCAKVGILITNAKDVWVRRVNFYRLAESSVYIDKTSQRVSVEDCQSVGAVSESNGLQSRAFYVQGSQCLCLRIQAEQGCHDFAVGATNGPNAFVQCWSLLPTGHSGCLEPWSSGVLFDLCSVSGNALRFGRINLADAFDAWTTTYSTLWNSTASMVSCDRPAFGQNYAYGAWGQFNGKGYWEGANNHQSPWSLFCSQWQQRMGQPSPQVDKLIGLGRGGTSTIADGRYHSERSRQALMMLSQWIDECALADPLPTCCDDASLRTCWQDHLPE